MARESGKVKAARHGIIYVGGQLIGSLAILITLIILARLLRPEYLGLYAIVIAFYTLFGLISTFALGATVRKKLPERKGIEEKRKLVANAYITALIFSLALAVVGIAASGYLANNIYHQPQLTGPLMLASILLSFWSVFNLTISLLVGEGKVVEATIIDVLYSALQMIFSPLLVALGYGVIGAIEGLAIGIIIGTVLGIYYIIRTFGFVKLSADKKTIIEILAFSVPVLISLLVIQGVYNLGILVLGTFTTPAIVGNYNVAYELGSGFAVIISSMVFVLLPTFSATKAKETAAKLKGVFEHSIYFSLLILAPIVAFVASVSRPLIYLLFSSAYTHAPPYFVIISFGIVLGVFWNYANILLLGTGDTKSVLKYQAIAAGVQIILLAILTPIFGILGVLAALFFISPIIINLIYLNVLRTKLSITLKVGRALNIAVSAAVLFVLLYLIYIAIGGYLSILVNLIATILVYPPLVIVLGAVGKNDLTMLRKIAGKKRIASPLMSIFSYAEIFVR